MIEMKNFHTLEDVELKDKTVLMRIDLNSTYDGNSGKIQDSDRVVEHAKTIKEVSERGAKLVLLSHQGRKGDPDFVHLDQHAKLLERHVGKPVEFIDDIIGERAKKRIKSLTSGEILLLDNVRFLEDETLEKSADQQKESSIVKNLHPIADMFVNDAFSVCHRSHASVVGFTSVMDSYAGLLLEKELRSAEKAMGSRHPSVYILGGAKPNDSIDIMKYMFDRYTLDIVLTCGVLGELCLVAQGTDIGSKTEDFLRTNGHLKLIDEVERLLETHGDKIKVPIDVAFDDNGVRSEILVGDLPADGLLKDVGKETIKIFRDEIQEAKTILIKGPVGIYEDAGFENGTIDILNSVKKSNAFSLVCGGDTTTAMKKLQVNKDGFDCVSVSGGAMIKFLSGQNLPGLEALKKWETKG